MGEQWCFSYIIGKREVFGEDIEGVAVSSGSLKGYLRKESLVELSDATIKRAQMRKWWFTSNRDWFQECVYKS